MGFLRRAQQPEPVPEPPSQDRQLVIAAAGELLARVLDPEQTLTVADRRYTVAIDAWGNTVLTRDGASLAAHSNALPAASPTLVAEFSRDLPQLLAAAEARAARDLPARRQLIEHLRAALGTAPRTPASTDSATREEIARSLVRQAPDIAARWASIEPQEREAMLRVAGLAEEADGLRVNLVSTTNAWAPRLARAVPVMARLSAPPVTAGGDSYTLAAVHTVRDGLWMKTAAGDHYMLGTGKWTHSPILGMEWTFRPSQRPSMPGLPGPYNAIPHDVIRLHDRFARELPDVIAGLESMVARLPVGDRGGLRALREMHAHLAGPSREVA